MINMLCLLVLMPWLGYTLRSSDGLDAVTKTDLPLEIVKLLIRFKHLSFSVD